MNFEGTDKSAFEQLSSTYKEYVRDIAARMEAGDDYFAATRQVLTNNRITNESDVARLIKAFSKPVDEARVIVRHEAEIEADIEATIKEEREAELLEDMERVRQERGGDPED